MGRPELRGNFSSILKDDSDIYRFPTLHMAETHFLLENPSISESSLGILENSHVVQVSPFSDIIV